LRDENRQLVNSILTSHHMPGIEAQRTAKDFKPLKRASWIDLKRRFEFRSSRPPVPVPPDPAKAKQSTDA
jgi:hypothetical protein